MSINSFFTSLTAEIIDSINNNYTDNYDYYRFGVMNASNQTAPFSIKKTLIKQLNSFGYYNNSKNYYFAKEVKNIDFPITDFLYLYSHLADDYSKDLLVKIIAYRMLGHTKVKLPLNTDSYWEKIKNIEANQDKNDFLKIDFMDQRLPLTNLQFLGFPIKMYYSAFAINIDFIVKQYEYNRDNILIKAEAGDVVIDAGGCFGDTALYFANETGKAGKVHVFEFIPDNIEILDKNLNLNPHLQKNIHLVKQPLWDISGKDVFYLANGPGSKVSLEFFEGHTGKTSTISIDDYIGENGIDKVDFIKMDIEGAETNALHGSVKTLKKYRPKLAIALYHSTKDFYRIPQFINELNLGYKFYLSHSTIYGEETMLFAVAE